MTRFSNINTLLSFVTVAREGSVSQAAEVLNLTQPAISHQIKRLSEETGIALFKRTSKGLEITEDGSAMLAKAEHVLDAMSEFQASAVRRVGRISGKLRIGTIVDPEFIRLGQLLKALRENYPDIETELGHGVSGEGRNRLMRGQVDAAFYLSSPEEIDTMQPMGPSNIHALKLTEFTYRVVGPSGWQNRIEDLDWGELASLPWIGTPENSAHNRLLTKIFDQQGCKQNVVARVDQEASMLEMVQSGIGLSLCRDSIALHQKQTHGLAVCSKVAVPACLSFIMLNESRERPVVKALIELLETTWQLQHDDA